MAPVGAALEAAGWVLTPVLLRADFLRQQQKVGASRSKVAVAERKQRFAFDCRVASCYFKIAPILDMGAAENHQIIEMDQACEIIQASADK